MRKITKRRLIFAAIAIVIAGVIGWLDYHYGRALNNKSFYTGWFMLGMLLFLAFFNVRKKLTFIPLGKGVTWTQLHVYVGVVISLLFLFHIDFTIPNGSFEAVLAVLFIVEIISGLIGIYISRTFPPILNRHGQSILYPRIPGFRKYIKKEVENLVVSSFRSSDSTAVVEFYAQRLLPYLSGPKDFFWHLFDLSTPYARWEQEFQSMERYLNDKEKETFQEVKDWTVTKTHLDSQFALQAVLKWWLFIHIPVSYILVIFVTLHLVLTYSFIGGL